MVVGMSITERAEILETDSVISPISYTLADGVTARERSTEFRTANVLRAQTNRFP